jgi:glycopeptide antibiotics resistance protein
MKKIAPDKWKHFYVGIGMGAVLQAFLLFLLKEHFVYASIIAFVLVVIISYGFEVLSLIAKRGHYDVIDAIAGIIGGVLGMGIVMLVHLTG